MKCLKCCKTRSNGTPLHVQDVTIYLCVCFNEQRDIDYVTNQPVSSTVNVSDKGEVYRKYMSQENILLLSDFGLYYSSSTDSSLIIQSDDKRTDTSNPPAYNAICKEPVSFEMNETKKADTELKRSINVKVQFDEDREYEFKGLWG